MNKDIVFVYGNFNIVHPGHLRLLRFAKSLQGKLYVGVASDKIAGTEGHVPEKLRLEVLKAIIGLMTHLFIMSQFAM